MSGHKRYHSDLTDTRQALIELPPPGASHTRSRAHLPAARDSQRHPPRAQPCLCVAHAPARLPRAEDSNYSITPSAFGARMARREHLNTALQDTALGTEQAS